MIGLACCVGPAVAALVGIVSATVAVDLATDLYSNWGWAFKLAAGLLGILVVLITRRRAARCSAARPGLSRFTATLAFSAVASYALLYGATTWLGARA